MASYATGRRAFSVAGPMAWNSLPDFIQKSGSHEQHKTVLGVYLKCRELPGERGNARNNARCTQAMKATHGLDGQHQDMDRTSRGRVDQND